VPRVVVFIVFETVPLQTGHVVTASPWGDTSLPFLPEQRGLPPLAISTLDQVCKAAQKLMQAVEPSEGVEMSSRVRVAVAIQIETPDGKPGFGGRAGLKAPANKRTFIIGQDDETMSELFSS
jgi:hypothetical protein